jgi:hypothetical protein
MKSVQIPRDEHERVVAAAEDRGMLISSVYRQAIQLWLATNNGSRQ